MKKKLFSLISVFVLLSFVFVSCNDDNNDPVPVTRIILQDSATLFLGNTVRLNATVLPTNAANQNVVWSANNFAVATIYDNLVTSVSAGTVNIAATTEDGNFTDTIVLTVGTFHCNNNEPGWGESLGTISFATDQTWMVGFQTWSDAVTATACQKETFAGGVGGASPNFNADCRSNPDFSGDLFSWCAVVRFADVLCPYPWRVPTMQDFVNLDIVKSGVFDMGVGGRNRNNDTPEFVRTRYIAHWGGGFGGYSSGGAFFYQGYGGFYWAQTDAAGVFARGLFFTTSGAVFPEGGQHKSLGLSLRCVR